MIRATVVGASGYAGAELIRILAGHPGVELAHLCAGRREGSVLGDLFPGFGPLGQRPLEADDPDLYLADSDLVFFALPHGLSVGPVTAALKAGKKVVDLGADFRFRQTAVYEEWYQVSHAAPELSAAAPYGLPELYRERIAGQSLVANPGCYPTGATLALYPLVRAGLVDLDSLIADSKSGISGAGRSLKDASLYCEAAESIKAYAVASHRHTPEIEQNLAEGAGREVRISFTPHLTPMSRGILTTAYAKLNPKGRETDLGQVFAEAYGDEYFIRLLPEGQWPETKWVRGTNFVFLGYTHDRRTGRAVVSTAIDNLGKGAAGQAVQNMNIICGLPEALGLTSLPVLP